MMFITALAVAAALALQIPGDGPLVLMAWRILTGLGVVATGVLTLALLTRLGGTGPQVSQRAEG
jgi:hypothetical protein